MANKYRMTPHGSAFIVNHMAGNTIGAYKTKREAKQNIEDCKRDDLMLESARDLVGKATDALMRMRHIDRQEAHDWIREAAG
jgi:AmiR/NasT family two-component response regulator